MSKTYLSGKVTGLSKEQYTKNFKRAAEIVEAAGMTAVNPIEVKLVYCEGVDACGGEGEIHHWACYMKHDLMEMLQCDTITMLPNWQDSAGAHVEFELADKLGMPSYSISYDYSEVYEWRNHHV